MTQVDVSSVNGEVANYKVKLSMHARITHQQVVYSKQNHNGMY